MVWNLAFLGFVKKLGSSVSTAVDDDDSVDRLNHRYTFAMVTVFLVLVAGKQYVGQPIECWVPKEFSGDWQAYAENFCWIKSTYWVPSDDEVLPDVDQRHENLIGYYQWVPFILLGIAFSFNVPRTVWSLSNWHSGIKLQKLLGVAHKAADNAIGEARSNAIGDVATCLQDALLQIEKTKSLWSRIKSWLCCLFSSSHTGSYLSTVYLGVKALYLVNVVVQIYLMSTFLGEDGFDILFTLAKGEKWHETGHFPRVTMCDFSIRSLGHKTKNYTVQCVLMINLFNEKIFLCLWLWYVLVLAAVLVSLVYWIVVLFSSGQRMNFIRHKLRTRKEYRERFERALQDFVERRLQLDGVFILRLIEANSGEIVATDVVQRLWAKYKPHSRYIDPNDVPQPDSELLSKDSSEPPNADVYV